VICDILLALSDMAFFFCDVLPYSAIGLVPLCNVGKGW
jgi:hypothetical protein